MQHSTSFGKGGQTDFVRLSPREIDVLLLVCRGLSNKEIAESLEITPGVVQGYVHQVFQGLRINSRVRAALWAVQPDHLPALSGDWAPVASHPVPCPCPSAVCTTLRCFSVRRAA